jgi:DNA repair protein SbcD/Mre11
VLKFIHAADIHLDSPLLKLDAYEGAPVGELRGATRRALANLVRTAIEERVAFVVIAGDLYDGDWKDYNTGLHFVSQMARLREAKIPVFVVAGNHDAATTITRSLPYPDNVRLFAAEGPETIRLDGLGVAIHGQSFGTAAVKANLARSYPSAVPGCFNIGLLHTSVTGREGHEPYAPCTLEDLREKGYDYWALGHVHQREVLLEEPWIVFAGNTQGRHARETGPKGCLLVSVDDAGRATVELKPLDVVRWARATVDASGAQSGRELRDRFRATLSAHLDHNPGVLMVLRVVIEGQTLAHDEIAADMEQWVNELRAVAVDEAGEHAWIEKIELRTAPLPSSEGKPAGAVSELLALVEELVANPEAASGLASELADLDKKLPRELKDAAESWRPSDPAWLAALVAQAKPLLVHRLLRGRKES